MSNLIIAIIIKNMKLLIKFFALPFLSLFLAVGYLNAAAEIEPVYGNFVIFTQQQNSVQLEAVAMETGRIAQETCNELGRLLHVETNRLSFVAESVLERTGSLDYLQIAQSLKVSVYMVVSIYNNGRETVAELRCTALDAAYKSMERNITVRSMLPTNIPVKIAREITLLHRNFPLKARARQNGSEYLLDAGQWHGLSESKYSANTGKLEVLATGRYRSTVSLGTNVTDNEMLIIDVYPDVDKVLKNLDARIEKNTLYRYGIGGNVLKGDDPEARFVLGACVINPGANACLPGYGAFLATEYLGFTKAELHVPGFVASLVAITGQLTLTEFMTGFDTNFFPWIQDADKSNATYRLQKFLWIGLPFTFTAAYFDQLAWQMMKSQNLPPFFRYKNHMAAALSLVLPGGGLMYKGRLLAGWTYYYTEMALLGYGIYNLHDKSGKYAFAAFGLLKTIELVHAFIASPNYSFYQFEKQSGSVSVGINTEVIEKESILKFGLTAYY